MMYREKMSVFERVLVVICVVIFIAAMSCYVFLDIAYADDGYTGDFFLPVSNSNVVDDLQSVGNIRLGSGHEVPLYIYCSKGAGYFYRFTENGYPRVGVFGVPNIGQCIFNGFYPDGNSVAPNSLSPFFFRVVAWTEYSEQFPLFSSVDEARASFDAFVAAGYPDDPSDVPDDPVSGTSRSFTLPSGNVAFVKVASSTGSIDLFCDNLPYAVTSDGSSVNSSNAYGYYGYRSSLPSGTLTYPPDDGMQGIDWLANGGTNLFGRTHNGKASMSERGGQYFVIYNPYAWFVDGVSSGSGSTGVSNISIRVSTSFSFSEVRVYPLNSSIGLGGQVIGGLDDGNYYDAVIDPETGDITWQDPSGGGSSLPIGGLNGVDTSETGLIAQIKGFFQDVVDTIKNVFGIAEEGIVNLVNASRNFLSKLATMYSWLPAPVYTVLTSAIVVVIIIGILKSFL